MPARWQSFAHEVRNPSEVHGRPLVLVRWCDKRTLPVVAHPAAVFPSA
jgi:hypothetical protein